ncbi:cupin domain-containing protein [Bifidobacterium phasiani]|uniref:Cupin domain-containing protein n=1 Tax=Bifidobacterium phasiani TaxID=2834431 RepID=A0ABS6W8V4_9BIFI|nr:cupin domain-containing protein [Bifidobacterium phasiani]MBW3082920.1 cupin domain-containing protein [Bifidobacterium phasiani]
MANYSKTSVAAAPRTELHDTLGLTGAEISVNNLPAGASVPFVHHHRKNEEIYGILAGKGRLEIDGESVDLAAGDWIRIAPAGRRRFFAADDEPLTFICVQVREGSLEGFTADDGVSD